MGQNTLCGIRQICTGTKLHSDANTTTRQNEAVCINHMSAAYTNAASAFRIRFYGNRDLRHIAALASGDSSGRFDAESHNGTHNVEYRDSLPFTKPSCPMDHPTLLRRWPTILARRDAVLFAVCRGTERGGYYGGMVYAIGERGAISCRDKRIEVRIADLTASDLC